MKALVTGANGLIGANLVRALLEQGHRVRAFVRPTSNLQSIENLEIERAVGDILDIGSLREAAVGCDVLFHVAAVFSYSRYTPSELLDIAGKGTVNALEAAKEAGVRRVVLTSSSVVFGSTLSPTPLDEGTRSPEPEPAPYVAAKIAQEEAAFTTAERLGIDLTAVCPTISVGPYDNALSESNAVIVNYLADPFKATWPGGCNIVSVQDVARGHILAAENGQPGMRYLLGSRNMEWSEIHRTISELCGIAGPLMTANHTGTYLAATFHEIMQFFTGKRPPVSRPQARMVGRYYWYRHDRAAAIGYKPMPARRALAKAISWLVAGHHVSNALRNSLQLSKEIYDEREREQTNHKNQFAGEDNEF